MAKRKLKQKPERWAVEVDWASEVDDDATIYAIEHDLCSRVVQKRGPNGWPVIEFSGSKRRIFALARQHHAEDYVKKIYPPSIPLL